MGLKGMTSRTIVACTALMAVGCGSALDLDLPNASFRIKRHEITIPAFPSTDILFVIDNSGSMAGKQVQMARSFGTFVQVMPDWFAYDRFHVAVITTGMESEGCQPCNEAVTDSCINETGEHGRFQSLFDIDFPSDCKVVDRDNLDCFYDEDTGRGTALVGTSGCKYQRGLAAMKQALQSPLLGTWNSNFLRQDATLQVVVISDGEDCGEVGEVTENIPGVDEKICSYAAKGVGPDGGSFHPDDPDRKSYELTPVAEYHDFLMGLKGHRKGMVRFAAIVGVADPEDPSTTAIEYDGTGPYAGIAPACSMPDCAGENCDVAPGTRHIELARMFGWNGFVNTICQEDFIKSLARIPDRFGCPRDFKLPEKILDPALVSMRINEEPLPRYSCDIPRQVQSCSGPDDTTCPKGACVQTWHYVPPEELGPPDPSAPGGIIVFAEHFDICCLAADGPVRIELIYVPE